MSEIKVCRRCNHKILKGEDWAVDYTNPDEQGEWREIFLCAGCEEEFQHDLCELSSRDFPAVA